MTLITIVTALLTALLTSGLVTTYFEHKKSKVDFLVSKAEEVSEKLYDVRVILDNLLMYIHAVKNKSLNTQEAKKFIAKDNNINAGGPLNRIKTVISFYFPNSSKNFNKLHIKYQSIFGDIQNYLNEDNLNIEDKKLEKLELLCDEADELQSKITNQLTNEVINLRNKTNYLGYFNK